MGSIVSGITGALGGSSGGDGGVSSAENSLLASEQQDEIQSMQAQGAQSAMQTQAQITSGWANTYNTISSDFEQVTQAKNQADQQIAQSYSQETKQA
jgi:hypothetical protein